MATSARMALVLVVIAFLLVFSAAEEQEAHSFQPGSHVSSASDADMMKAIRTVLMRSLRSPRYHGGRRYEYVKRFPEVNARGFESDIFDEGFGDFSPVRRR